MSLPTSALNEAHPYSGFKLPPEKISSQMSYDYQTIEVLDSELAYVEFGEGDNFLFLHGVPTSSYLWRNIMPHLDKQARVIAMDNIGFGHSGKPDIQYTFADHYRYLEAFIEAKELENITLVMHDWGSAIGLHYARQHPENVKAIVTMEAIIAPLLPAPSYDSLPRGSANFFRQVREPETGKARVIEENYMIESALTGAIIRPLASEAHDHYREPFLEPESRLPLYMFPNQMPIAGVPKDTHDVVTAYNHWLTETETPWLMLYAKPGALNPPQSADYWARHARNIDIVYIGRGSHFVQEDQPYAIGRAISDWYRGLGE